MSELIIQESRYLPAVQIQAIEAITREFMHTVRRDFTVPTYRSYKDGMKRFIGWYKGTGVDEIKEVLLEYRADLRASYTSPNTINAHLTTLRGFTSFIYERGITETDLGRSLKNIKKSDGHTKTALDRYQLHDLMESLNSRRHKRNGERNRMMIILAVSNGLRINEIANISIEDISQREDDKIIYLLRKGYSDKSCYTILSPKTYKELQKFIGIRDIGPLFQNESGGSLSTDSIGRIIRDCYRRAGIKNKAITPHSLRHTFAKLCIEAGVDVLDLSKALNHKSVDTTMVYLTSLNRHKRSAEKAVEIDY